MDMAKDRVLVKRYFSKSSSDNFFFLLGYFLSFLGGFCDFGFGYLL